MDNEIEDRFYVLISKSGVNNVKWNLLLYLNGRK